jgi:hypothetical protein
MTNQAFVPDLPQSVTAPFSVADSDVTAAGRCVVALGVHAGWRRAASEDAAPMSTIAAPRVNRTGKHRNPVLRRSFTLGSVALRGGA